MRSKLSKVVVAVASVAAFGAVGVRAASAQMVGVCAFTGHAAAAPPVKYLGGGGAWGFDSQIAVCAGTSGGNVGAETASIHAAGTYASLVCGTSDPLTVVGAVNVTPTALVAGAGTIGGGANVLIPFVGGQGIITGDFFASSGEVGKIAGYVTIIPNGTQQTGPLPGFGGAANNPDLSVSPVNGDCVTSYAVAGAFAVAGIL